MAFNEDIIELANRGTNFREVVATARYSQVVVMCIPPGGEIGDEVHPDVDQVLVFVAGEGVAILDGERTRVGPGRLVQVPAGTRHNFVNTGPADCACTRSTPRPSTPPARSIARRRTPTPPRRSTRTSHPRGRDPRAGRRSGRGRATGESQSSWPFGQVSMTARRIANSPRWKAL